ncbi:MAG: tRNA (adenosine(37)-N6)-threonylcarbamoyltransferase complex ATPase subunit type 1 TsaE [Patescibacteria group bacterium]
MRDVIIKIGEQKKKFYVPTEKDWGEIAIYLAKIFKSGSIVALSGSLGAGKTALVQALAAEFKIKRLPQSPTFSLLRSYELPCGSRYYSVIKRLLHMDAYRIKNENELLALDLDDELKIPGSILLIEWPENMNIWLKKRKLKVITVNIKAPEND